MSASDDVAVNVHRLADGAAALHLVNYDYDADNDHVSPVKAVDVTVRLPFEPATATLVTPGGGVQPVGIDVVDGMAKVGIAELGVYAIVVFARAADSS